MIKHFIKTAKPLIIAHRGESYDAPENTLKSINLAWQRGADGIEIDVHLSMDNEIMVVHNKKIKTVSGKSLSIKSHTAEELKKYSVNNTKIENDASETIPTLKEVLSTVPIKKYIFIEIKCGVKIIPALIRTLNQSKLDTEQIKLIGFGLKKMSLVKNAFPEYEIFLNKRVSMGKIFPGSSYWDNLIKKLKINFIDGINLSYTRSLNFKLVEKLKLNKVKIFIWTINSPKRAIKLIELGVDGIMSDRQGWLREKINL
ncbi:MAG: hypothetical protein IH620_07765 [Ignavibacterium sp.]|nr:hypothetical protein [Ignavibacterium sp.]